MMRRSSYIRWVLLCLGALVLVLATGCRRESGPHGGHGQPPPAAPACPLDGAPTTTADISRRPLAVLIENSPKARPQSGLDKACIVYEAITEGGITRFLAIYLHADAPVIGPVRSARPHFIYLAQGFDAALVHCGQSYEALQIFTRSPEIRHLDELKTPKPFWRSSARRAPHNLYTSTEHLRTFLQRQGGEGRVAAMPRYAGGAPLATGLEAPEATLKFGGVVQYTLRLVYDADRRGYLRYMDGKLHTDKESGKPLVAHNVIIQRVTAMPYATSTHGTFDVRVMGTGPGELLSNGRRIAIRWQKDTATSGTRFTDESGTPLALSPGQTWVEIVSTDGSVSFARPASP